jgi:predicted RNase H-like nuclease (RuvC/YqgF family)
LDEENKRIIKELKEKKIENEEMREVNQGVQSKINEMAVEVEMLRHQQKENSRDDREELIYYKNQAKDLSEKLSQQKNRISYLEETLRSTDDKTKQNESTNGRENKIDTSRVPTFSRNVFTQDDETNSLKNKQESNTVNINK